MARTQRVENLKKNFMQYHQAGYSIPEIAAEFNVDFSTVYKYLDEIAKENGVTRESLLQNASFTKENSPASFRKDRIDIEELQKNFDNLNTDLTTIITQLDNILTQE